MAQPLQTVYAKTMTVSITGQWASLCTHMYIYATTPAGLAHHLWTVRRRLGYLPSEADPLKPKYVNSTEWRLLAF